MAAGPDRADHGRVVRAQRHEPAPGARGAHGVDPPDRAAAGGSSSASGSAARPRSTRRTASTFPAAPERVARLEEAVAVIRALWTGGPVTRESPFYPLHEASRPPRPGPAAADHHRWRDAGRGAAWPVGSATAGRPSTTTSSRTCRSISRRSRRPVAGARTSACSSASRATGWATNRSTESPWVQAPRETWERWQSAGADGAIVLARTTPTSTRWSRRPSAGSGGSWHHQRRDITPKRDAAPRRLAAHPRSSTPASGAARRSPSMSACASAATRSACATRRRRRCTASRSGAWSCSS